MWQLLETAQGKDWTEQFFLEPVKRIVKYLVYINAKHISSFNYNLNIYFFFLEWSWMLTIQTEEMCRQSPKALWSKMLMWYWEKRHLEAAYGTFTWEGYRFITCVTVENIWRVYILYTNKHVFGGDRWASFYFY